jgi:hypothetical protein
MTGKVVKLTRHRATKSNRSAAARGDATRTAEFNVVTDMEDDVAAAIRSILSVFGVQSMRPSLDEDEKHSAALLKQALAAIDAAASTASDRRSNAQVEHLKTSAPAPVLAPVMTQERAEAIAAATRAGVAKETKAKAISGLSAAVNRVIAERREQQTPISPDAIDRELCVRATDSPRLALAKATARAVRGQCGDNNAAAAIDRARALAARAI